MSDGLADERRVYARGALTDAHVRSARTDGPLQVLATWIDEARDAGSVEPTAMALATADASGPDVRVVLCKALDHGVVWFTSHLSAKSRQLAASPRAAVVFHWQELERQVRLRGTTTRLTSAEDDAYFASRPRESRLGAWASGVQSAPVADRATLEADLETARARFEGTPVPRPEHWGGWRLVPDAVELWQGRPGRLHDRVLLTPGDDGWDATRLRP